MGFSKLNIGPFIVFQSAGCATNSVR